MKCPHNGTHRMITLSIILLLSFLIFQGCSGCAEKDAQETPIDAPEQEIEGGHFHADGTRHTDPPSEPDRIDASLPGTNPPTHRPPLWNPFSVPNYIQDNPHLFEVGADGNAYILSPEVLEKKVSQIMDISHKENWTVDVYIEKMAEGIAETLLAEGISKLAIVRYISGTTVASAEYKRDLLNAARAENPNDFETLLLWARRYVERKPAEAETVYRRLIQMQPDSDRAHFYFGYHILQTHPEPREAIPALEKAYQLNPNLHAALMHLARAHKKLGQYEQALKYYQASWDRSPSRSASFGISYVKSKLAEQQTTPQGDR